MSWEKEDAVHKVYGDRCIPCGDMSWECFGKNNGIRIVDAFRAET